MTTNAEYKARITSYNWDDLIKLWSEIESGNTPNWDAGKALEPTFRTSKCSTYTSIISSIEA